MPRRTRFLLPLIAFGFTVVCCRGVAAPPGPVAAPAKRGDASAERLARALRWMDGHRMAYRMSRRYETGDADTFVKYPPRGAEAVYSFDLPMSHTHYPYLRRYKRAYLYDNALAVILWSLAGEFEKAKGLLTTMEDLQNPDGSTGFSWNCWGDGFYNRHYKRTGAIAWAGYAAVTYERLSGDDRFRKFTEKTAGYVLSQQVTDPEDPRFGFFKGGHGFWSEDYRKLADRPAEFCCVEHQIDSYFFLRDCHTLTGKGRYRQAALLLRRRMMDVLWDDCAGHFHVAVDAKGVNRDLALDASSWGAIFLCAIGEAGKARRALAFVERTFKSSANDIKGFKAYAGQYRDHPAHDWDRLSMVWSEGSLGVALAQLKVGDRRACGAIVSAIGTMQQATGGVCYTAYADDLALPAEAVKAVDGRPPTDALDEFLRCPSVAGTAWLGIVEVSRQEGANDFWGPDPEGFGVQQGHALKDKLAACRGAVPAIEIVAGGRAVGRVGTFAGRGGAARSRLADAPGAGTARSACYDVSFDQGKGGFCGWYVDFLRKPIDAGEMQVLELVVRGGAGGEKLRAGLRDTTADPNDDAILVDLPPLSQGWQTLKVPLRTFAGLRPSKLASVVLMPETPELGTFHVDSIRLTSGATGRRIEFAGRTWEIKSGPRLGPGPNRWSDAEDAVWCDDQGLHLTITKRDTGFHSTEVMAASAGYGEYVFVIGGDLAHLDRNAVLGCFLYQSDTEEVDFELATWGKPHDLDKGFLNAQFCCQPAAKDSMIRFDTGDARVITVSLLWSPEQFRGRCWSGTDRSQKPLADWTYVGPKNLRHNRERVYVNLWLMGGKAPVSGQPQEVVIQSFSFVPVPKKPM